MSYEWDPQKAESNYQKHGIHLADAVSVFEDEFALWQEDKGDYDEVRFVIIGLDYTAQIVTVVFTFRGNDIRLISARKATRGEKKNYESGRQ